MGDGPTAVTTWMLPPVSVPAWQADERANVTFTIRWEPPSPEDIVAERMSHDGEPRTRILISMANQTPEATLAVGERAFFDNGNGSWTEIFRHA